MVKNVKSLLILGICLLIPIIGNTVAAEKQNPIEGAKSMIQLYEHLLNDPKSTVEFAQQHLEHREGHGKFTSIYEGKYNEFDIQIGFGDSETSIKALGLLTNNPIDFKYVVKKMTQKYGKSGYRKAFLLAKEVDTWTCGKVNVMAAQDGSSTILLIVDED